eukprot:scaffold81013_cov64-Phaeocystis_antarctica.AAC.2
MLWYVALAHERNCDAVFPVGVSNQAVALLVPIEPNLAHVPVKRRPAVVSGLAPVPFPYDGGLGLRVVGAGAPLREPAGLQQRDQRDVLVARDRVADKQQGAASKASANLRSLGTEDAVAEMQAKALLGFARVCAVLAHNSKRPAPFGRGGIVSQRLLPRATRQRRCCLRHARRGCAEQSCHVVRGCLLRGRACYRRASIAPSAAASAVLAAKLSCAPGTLRLWISWRLRPLKFLPAWSSLALALSSAAS